MTEEELLKHVDERCAELVEEMGFSGKSPFETLADTKELPLPAQPGTSLSAIHGFLRAAQYVAQNPRQQYEFYGYAAFDDAQRRTYMIVHAETVYPAVPLTGWQQTRSFVLSLLGFFLIIAVLICTALGACVFLVPFALMLMQLFR